MQTGMNSIDSFGCSDTHNYCVYFVPMSPSLVAYVDGGSRGTRGPAGIGVVIEHSCGRRVEISEPVECGDNNYAEYAALLVALKYATNFQCSRLRVLSDSEVVVRQISGLYTCQSLALREIYDDCKALIDSLQQFTIQHIRRTDNADADRLANAAMDRAGRKRSRANAGFDLSTALPAPV
jgi:ribonuclease HI